MTLYRKSVVTLLYLAPFQRHKSCNVSETGQDRAKVTADLYEVLVCAKIYDLE